MSIKFGWTGGSQKPSAEVDPFNGEAVLIMKALDGKRRKFEFSNGAVSALGLYQRTNGLEEQPMFSGRTISKAFDEDNNEYFIFVNDNNHPDVEQININKTNCGFSDRATYDFLAQKYSLNTSVDNYILLNSFEQEMVDASLFKIMGVYTPVSATPETTTV